MKFDPFVLPFTTGLGFLFLYFSVKVIKWLNKLSVAEKLLISKNILTRKSFHAIAEVFMESLLHRKIYKQNLLMGYMHSSLALGWFLLIVLGNLESRLYYPTNFNPPYFPIFLNYFSHDTLEFSFTPVFKFLMDFLLLIVLSGVFLALLKRWQKIAFGMQKTTTLKMRDKIPLYSLWLIFPLRFLAESFTAGMYHNGGFATNALGNLLISRFPGDKSAYIFWWLYSLALGAFFFSLPWSRYMHIPTEIVLIFLKNYGLYANKKSQSLREIEVLSCSRCGICLNSCQIMSAAKVNQIQAVYFLKSVREKQKDENKTFNCLVCGRCQQSCPVGIQLNDRRIYERELFHVNKYKTENYVISNSYVPKSEIVWFAGCMTHLTPRIKQSFQKLLEISKTEYTFLDKEGSICCGRPLILSGMKERASQLIDQVGKLIRDSGATTLVLSCPICLKTFNENYNLDIEILHHSQFLLRLVEQGKLNPVKDSFKEMVYHDPCELGRGSGIYSEPRELLEKCVKLVNCGFDKENSLCCGGSLGGFRLTPYEKDLITFDVLEKTGTNKTGYLATACPLCKKTFNKSKQVITLDIAEVLLDSVINQPSKISASKEVLAV